MRMRHAWCVLVFLFLVSLGQAMAADTAPSIDFRFTTCPLSISCVISSPTRPPG